MKKLLIPFMFLTACCFGAVDDSYTTTLMHFNGNITDEAGDTWTAVNGALASTTQKKFGSGSLYTDGSNDYIVASDSDSWAFGSGNFTIDFWAYMPSTAADQNRRMITHGSGLDQFFLRLTNARNVAFQNVNAGTTSLSMVEAGQFNLNQWFHVAMVRDSNRWILFRNGNIIAQATSTANISTITADRKIGGGETEYFAGYLDEIRVSKGVARWTTTFTPQTSEYIGVEPIVQNFLFADSGLINLAGSGRILIGGN